MNQRLTTNDQRHTTAKAAVVLVGILLSAAVCRGATAEEYYAAGEGMYESGDYAKAAEYFGAAVKLDSAMVQAYYMLGNSYVKLGNKRAAAAAFEGYLRFKPDDDKMRGFVAQLKGGARPPPKFPAGSIVVFDDHFNIGVKVVPGEKVKTKIREVRTAPAFGSHCLSFKGDPKQKSASMKLDWLGAWGATGIRQAGDLSEHLEKGALVFWVKGKNGSETFDVILANPPQEEFGGGSFENKIPLAPYVATTTEWQKVIVPLKDFRKRGSLWGRRRGARPKSHYREFDWSQVASLRLQTTTKYYAQANDSSGRRQVMVIAEFVVFFDQLVIVPEYSVAEYKELRQRCRDTSFALADDGAGNIVIFDDRVRGRWWNASPPPYSFIIIDETDAKVGKKSLMINMDPSKWSWSGCGLGYFDFTPFYKTGSLQFWIKGKHGNEGFLVGFDSVEAGGFRAGTHLDIRPYVTVSSTRWKKVTIPLMDFPPSQRNWPTNKRRAFNWAGVNMLYFQIAPMKEPEYAWWLDDVKVMTK